MEDHSPEFQLFLSIFSKLMAFPRCVPNVYDFVVSISFRFLLSEHVNSKNNVFRDSKVADEVLQTTLHFVECTAWVAMNKLGIIGPYWFEHDDDRSQTVNKGRYMAVLNKYESFTMVSARRGHTSYYQRNPCLVEAEVRRETQKQKVR